MNKLAIIYYQSDNWGQCLEKLPKVAQHILLCLGNQEKCINQICSEVLASKHLISVYLRRLRNSEFVETAEDHWYVEHPAFAQWLSEQPAPVIGKEQAKELIGNTIFTEAIDYFAFLERQGVIKETGFHLASKISQYAKEMLLENWKDG